MKFKIKLNSIFRTRAFTLIELLVGIVIFTLLVGSVIGVFISAIRIQRYTLAYENLLDQSSYVMEYMSKALRMAKKGSLGGACTVDKNYEIKQIPSTSVNGLMFEKYDTTSGAIKCKGFFVENNTLKDYEEGRAVSILPLLSSKIKVNAFNVNIIDETGQQSKVTIYLEMEETSSNPHPKIKIQTAVSQRDLNQ